jgi:hypothetical protein
MDKLEYALNTIRNCDFCYGKGYVGWSNGEDYDMEDCECNPYGLILDDDGDVIWDNGLLSQNELSIYATAEAN